MGELTAEQYIDKSTPDRMVLAKAYEIGPNVDLTKAEQQSTDAVDSPFAELGLLKSDSLDPPYNPEKLCKIYEHSSSLRQNVDAYKTNIDGFGHVFEPVVQLKEAGARELVADAIFLERQQAVAEGIEGALDTAASPPTDEDITQQIDMLRSAMRIEKAQVESFFAGCVADASFTALRRMTREDIEVTGNGYWEVIRNDEGVVSQFAGMPARSVRVLKTKSKAMSVTQQVRTGLLTFKSESFKRRFRRYAQIGVDEVIYFKEFGDPTIMSNLTGKSFESVDELRLAEPNADPANEVFHFKIHSLKNGAYGVPRWIGALLSVLGSRSAEEVNLAYFDNKSIPPMAILVSGGRLGEDSVKRIQDFVETQIKGRRSFHKILVIEAETTAGSIGLGDNTGQMRVEIKTLTDAQLKDGLFLAYDAANMDKVGMTFRLPRLLRGDIRDFNRASAEAALDFAESQVFVPERNDFDFAMNRFILPVLGIKYWTFKSNGPRLSDAQSWGDMIVKLTNAGILTPADARELTSKKVLAQELPIVEADWTKQPLALTIAGIQADNTLDGEIPMGDATGADAGAGAVPTDLGTNVDMGLLKAAKRRLIKQAKSLLKLRDEFFKQEAAEAVKQYQKERVEDGAVVYQMTEQEMADIFGIKKAS